MCGFKRERHAKLLVNNLPWHRKQGDTPSRNVDNRLWGRLIRIAKPKTWTNKGRKITVNDFRIFYCCNLGCRFDNYIATRQFDSYTYHTYFTNCIFLNSLKVRWLMFDERIVKWRLVSTRIDVIFYDAGMCM